MARKPIAPGPPSEYSPAMPVRFPSAAYEHEPQPLRLRLVAVEPLHDEPQDQRATGDPDPTTAQ